MGIDGSCWSNRRGYGRFTRALVTEMVTAAAHSYVLVIDRQSLAGAELPDGLSVIPVDVSVPPARAAAAGGSRRVVDVLRMSRAAWRARFDVFFFPSSYSYYPVLRVPTVVTVHDAIAERFPGLVLPDRRARFLWNLKQRAAVRAARAVVTVSAASRDEIHAALRVPESRLHVVREAPDPIFRPVGEAQRREVLRRFGLDGARRYLLYVGGISPHKNLEALIAAFDEVAARDAEVRLVLVGETDDDPFLSSVAAVQRAVAASPASGRISLTGYVSDDDLAALYGGAVATVLPSVSEGFGLTAAESAACGTPVVASDVPAMRELLEDAALYAPPGDARALAAALGRLLHDDADRARHAEASLRKASEWSWREAVVHVTQLLEKVASRRA